MLKKITCSLCITALCVVSISNLVFSDSYDAYAYITCYGEERGVACQEDERGVAAYCFHATATPDGNGFYCELKFSGHTFSSSGSCGDN